MSQLRRKTGFDPVLIAVAGAVLLGLWNWYAVGAAAEKPRLSVVYEPPRFSVDAKGVSVTQVLEAIGAKAGFTVTDAGLARPELILSIKDAPLDAVLRQLLRTESSLLVYEDAEGGGSLIKTIMLLGPATARAGTEPGAAGIQSPLGAQSFGPQRSSPEAPPTTLPRASFWAGPGSSSGAGAGGVGEVPAVGGAPLPPAGLATVERSSSVPAAPPLPFSEELKRQLLERVRVQVEAARRATLDVPGGSQTPSGQRSHLGQP